MTTTWFRWASALRIPSVPTHEWQRPTPQMAEADRACFRAFFSERCRNGPHVAKKTKHRPAEDRRGEGVTNLAAPCMELFADELDRINHSLRVAELPREVGRHKGPAKLRVTRPCAAAATLAADLHRGHHGARVRPALAVRLAHGQSVACWSTHKPHPLDQGAKHSGGPARRNGLRVPDGGKSRRRRRPLASTKTLPSRLLVPNGSVVLTR